MSQLKPSFIQDVRKALLKSCFTPDDFTLDFPKSGRVLAKIGFLYKPEYSLVLLEEEKQESVTIEQKYLMSSRTERVTQVVYTIKVTPGRFKLYSAIEVSEPGALLEELPKWCENIKADLYALAPAIDPMEQLRTKLNESMDGLVKDPAGFFTDEELATVDRRFDQLYSDIEALREQYSITKGQLAELQRELEEFKKSARAYPKGIWAKVTTNRLVKATGQIINSPEGRTFLFQQIKRAIGFSDDA
jgi:hypothetical protein